MKYLNTILLLTGTFLTSTAAHPTVNVDSTIIPMNETDISTSTNFHDNKWHLVSSPSDNDNARAPSVWVYCETSNASPRADYALLAAANLAKKNDMHTCTVENAKGCKKMWGYDHAALGICGPWGFAVTCPTAAGYYKKLISQCMQFKAGNWRAGGYVRIINTEVWGDVNLYKV